MFRVEFGNGWHDTEGITGEENDILRVTTDGWELHIADVLKRVDDTSVWSEADIVIVDHALLALILVVASVLYNGSELDGIINIGFLSTRESISLSVATSLNVEDVLISPYVLVITDEQALRVRGKGGLTSAREAKEDSGVAIGSDVGRAVHAESATLGHVVVHDAEDAFLHLTCVGCAQNDELLGGEVDSDRCRVANVSDLLVSDELSRVHDGEVRAAIGEV